MIGVLAVVAALAAPTPAMLAVPPAAVAAPRRPAAQTDADKQRRSEEGNREQGERDQGVEQREAEPTPQGRQAPTVERRSDVLYVRFDDAEIDGSIIHATNVTVESGEYVLTGGKLDGDIEGDLVFSLHPTLTYRGQTMSGELIRFSPNAKTYRIEGLRTALTPEFLQNRTTGPIFAGGGAIEGHDRDPITGTETDVTTCDLPAPHYTLLAREIEITPGKRVVLRQAAVAWRGRRLVTLPTVVVPLDRRLPRGGYRPMVGRSVEEGWFAKTAFNYMAGRRAPGLYRIDLMERKGIGLGLQQAWTSNRFAGEAAVYGIPAGGQGSNVSGRLDSRLSLGGGQTMGLRYDTRRNSYLTMPDSSDESYRLTHDLRTDALASTLSLNRRSNRSGSYSSDSTTAGLAERLTLGKAGSLNLNADYSRYTSGSGDTSQTTEQLATRLQSDYRAPNYTLQVAANKNVPMGGSTSQSYFGGVERLPEVGVSQYRFTKGTLSTLPLVLSMTAGHYSEGGGTQTGSSRTVTDRFSLGYDMTGLRYTLGPRTDLDVSTGFQQYLYGEGAAQYVLKGASTFTQRWAKRSGVTIRYTYQQPHGGTPFRFDRQGKYHRANGDIGLLDDGRLQFSARFGYDFAGSTYGGIREPWETVSANVLYRPSNRLSLRNLISFDPDNGTFTSVTTDLRVRGRNDFALDVVGRYDPRTHRFGQVNAYVNLPVLPRWRAIVLAQYNGYLTRFESRNLQIIHDMHCLEATLTFIDNPYGWRAERQVMFGLRVKAFPAFQQFGTGMYGQALDTSVGAGL